MRPRTILRFAASEGTGKAEPPLVKFVSCSCRICEKRLPLAPGRCLYWRAPSSGPQQLPYTRSHPNSSTAPLASVPPRSAPVPGAQQCSNVRGFGKVGSSDRQGIAAPRGRAHSADNSQCVPNHSSICCIRCHRRKPEPRDGRWRTNHVRARTAHSGPTRPSRSTISPMERMP